VYFCRVSSLSLANSLYSEPRSPVYRCRQMSAAYITLL